MTENFIKDYWESQGLAHGESHCASWGDNWMIDLEIETIKNYINDGDCVLDVGCANGYATFKQAELHKLASITGVDFATNMIKTAQKIKKERPNTDNISFFEGDIRQLQFPDNTFDMVYTTRVLINLPNWEQQLQGINECIRVTKPNGLIVLSEAFWEPLMLLNAMRALSKLPPLVEHDFNRYIKQQSLEQYLLKLGYKYHLEDFSSVYYLGSRFLRELVTDHNAYPGYENPINKLFYELEKQFSGGGMGIQKAVIIEK